MDKIQQGASQYPSRWAKVLLKSCGCGVLAGEICDCRAFATEYEAAPEIHIPPRGWRVTR